MCNGQSFGRRIVVLETMSVIDRISNQGWVYSGAIAFNRIVPKWLFRCRRYRVYRLAVQPAIAADDDGCQVGWCASEAQLQAIEHLTYFRRAYSRGPVRAVQATVEGRLVGGFWAATEYFDEDDLGVRVVLEPKQVWLFAALVSRECRGLGVYAKILRFITSELAAEGLTDQLVAVNPDNKPSHRAHQKYARACAGTVFAARVLNCSICFSSKTVKQQSWFTTNSKERPIEICFQQM